MFHESQNLPQPRVRLGLVWILNPHGFVVVVEHAEGAGDVRNDLLDGDSRGNGENQGVVVDLQEGSGTVDNGRSLVAQDPLVLLGVRGVLQDQLDRPPSPHLRDGLADGQDHGVLGHVLVRFLAVADGQAPAAEGDHLVDVRQVGQRLQKIRPDGTLDALLPLASQALERAVEVLDGRRGKDQVSCRVAAPGVAAA